jgi:hypothetical protein
MKDDFGNSLARLEEDVEVSDFRDREEALLALAQRYSYVYPTPGILAMLSELGPIVEVGAGTGYWAYRLRMLEVDVVAYDQAPPDGELVNRYHVKTETWIPVLEGDQTALLRHQDRALFLCWPPLYSSLGNCLSYYRGDVLAYIGDSGFRTAALDHLEDTFARAAVMPVKALDPDPDAAPSLSIWKRRSCGRALRT